MQCTEYVYDYQWEGTPLCQCPICKGFLPRYFPLDKPFKCKKCGTDLLVFADIDEETGEKEDWGKICPISEVNPEDG